MGDYSDFREPDVKLKEFHGIKGFQEGKVLDFNEAVLVTTLEDNGIHELTDDPSGYQVSHAHVREALREFLDKNNPNTYGLVNPFNKNGEVSEKEELRAAYMDDMALCHVNELKPFGERISERVNRTISEYKNSDMGYAPNYKHAVLQALSHVYVGKCRGLTEKDLNFMIDNSDSGDYLCIENQSMAEMRQMFEKGITPEQMKSVLAASNSENYHIVNMYLESEPFNEDVIKAIADSKDMGEAFEIYSSVHFKSPVELKPERALDVMKQTNKILTSIENGDNPALTNPNSFGAFISGTASYSGESYAHDVISMMSKYDSSYDSEKFDKYVDKFLQTTTRERLLCDFDKTHPYKMRELQPCGKGEGYVMFYADANDSHGCSYNEAKQYSEENDMKFFLGNERQGFNGDTYICYKDRSCLPTWMQSSAEKAEIKDAAEKTHLPDNVPSAKSSCVISDINKNRISEKQSRSGDTYYRVSVYVPKTYSESGYASITCNKNQLSKQDDGTYSVTFNTNSFRSVGVRKTIDGKPQNVVYRNQSMSELAGEHKKAVDSYNNFISKTKVRGEAFMENKSDEQAKEIEP